MFPTEAKDPRFREIFDYWLSKAPPGRLPGRQHVDPLEIHRLLPGVVLVDVIPTGAEYRFRFRLIGTLMVEIFGADFTGKFIDQVVLQVGYDAIHANFASIIRTKQPHYWETPLTVAGRDFFSLARLALPLANDGENVDMILTYFVPSGRQPQS
ncbi:MAG: PAS domain-containing protein [Rhodospirillales bacterium]|nr:PAS domain-containing protein [Rhodospirillales bacterium]